LEATLDFQDILARGRWKKVKLRVVSFEPGEVERRAGDNQTLVIFNKGGLKAVDHIDGS